MAKKKRKEEKATGSVELKAQPVSTRSLERPKGSIRIVPGRKDAK